MLFETSNARASSQACIRSRAVAAPSPGNVGVEDSAGFAGNTRQDQRHAAQHIHLRQPPTVATRPNVLLQRPENLEESVALAQDMPVQIKTALFTPPRSSRSRLQDRLSPTSCGRLSGHLSPLVSPIVHTTQFENTGNSTPAMQPRNFAISTSSPPFFSSGRSPRARDHPMDLAAMQSWMSGDEIALSQPFMLGRSEACANLDAHHGEWCRPPPSPNYPWLSSASAQVIDVNEVGKTESKAHRSRAADWGSPASSLGKQLASWDSVVANHSGGGDVTSLHVCHWAIRLIKDEERAMRSMISESERELRRTIGSSQQDMHTSVLFTYYNERLFKRRLQTSEVQWALQERHRLLRLHQHEEHRERILLASMEEEQRMAMMSFSNAERGLLKGGDDIVRKKCRDVPAFCVLQEDALRRQLEVHHGDVLTLVRELFVSQQRHVRVRAQVAPLRGDVERMTGELRRSEQLCSQLNAALVDLNGELARLRAQRDAQDAFRARTFAAGVELEAAGRSSLEAMAVDALALHLQLISSQQALTGTLADLDRSRQESIGLTAEVMRLHEAVEQRLCTADEAFRARAGRCWTELEAFTRAAFADMTQDVFAVRQEVWDSSRASIEAQAEAEHVRERFQVMAVEVQGLRAALTKERVESAAATAFRKRVCASWEELEALGRSAVQETAQDEFGSCLKMMASQRASIESQAEADRLREELRGATAARQLHPVVEELQLESARLHGRDADGTSWEVARAALVDLEGMGRMALEVMAHDAGALQLQVVSTHRKNVEMRVGAEGVREQLHSMTVELLESHQQCAYFNKLLQDSQQECAHLNTVLEEVNEQYVVLRARHELDVEFQEQVRASWHRSEAAIRDLEAAGRGLLEVTADVLLWELHVRCGIEASQVKDYSILVFHFQVVQRAKIAAIPSPCKVKASPAGHWTPSRISADEEAARLGVMAQESSERCMYLGQLMRSRCLCYRVLLERKGNEVRALRLRHQSDWAALTEYVVGVHRMVRDDVVTEEQQVCGWKRRITEGRSQNGLHVCAVDCSPRVCACVGTDRNPRVGHESKLPKVLFRGHQ